jgi:dipeptidyl aminopeptidase/acylaminoacyl peptidase
MMTLMALAKGAPVRAAIVISPITDVQASVKERPTIHEVLLDLMPGYADHPEAELRARSAIEWPEKIGVPLLMLHGTADWRAPAGTQALPFAQKLQALGKKYELVLYDDDGHGVDGHRADRDRVMVEWLQAHMMKGHRCTHCSH